MKKLIEIIEGTFALTALISIIAVSVFGVMAMNPREYANADTVEQVAGIESSKNVIPFKVTNLTNAENPKSSLTTKEQNGSIDNTYLASFNSAMKGSYTTDFVKIDNDNNNDGYIYVKAIVKGDIQDSIKITIQDGVDDIIVYGKNYKDVNRRLTIPKNSSKQYKIKYEMMETINFPFQLYFDFTQN